MSDPIVLCIVLNKVEVLDRLLNELNDAGIKGATVIHSTGMGHMLTSMEDSHIISAMRAFLQSSGEENRTIFAVLPADRIATAREVLTRVVGDLSQPNTAIMFGMPTVFNEGITHF